MARDIVAGLTLLGCALALSGLGVAQANAPLNIKSPASAHVYFVTGRFGIAPGLDGLVKKVRQRGLPITIANPSGSHSVAQSAIRAYQNADLRSIILVGFSAGGRASLNMAGQLNTANVPVELVLIIDAISVPPISPNVRKLVNYYGGLGNPVARPSDFPGVLQNVLVKGPNVGHFSIIDMKEEQLLGHVLSAASL
jgi:hypothetical protein